MATYRNQMIHAVALVLCLFATAAKGNAATHTAASCSLSDVSAAIAAAEVGDTVKVPPGTCTWTDKLTITKGISLIGGGSADTIIVANIPNYCGGGYSHLLGSIVTYNPTNWDANAAFRLSGFTFDQNNMCLGLKLGASNKEAPFTVQTKIRIDHNKFTNATDTLMQAIWNYGGMYGVVDNNIFDGVKYPIRNSPQIQNSSWWNNFSYSFGASDNNLYYEDNVFSGLGDVIADCQYSGRYAFRYNTVNATTDIFYGLDLHGNWPYAHCSNDASKSCNSDSDCVSPGTCQLDDPVNGSNMWSCFGAEVYGNEINTTSNVQATQIYAARGGKSLVFYNNVNSMNSFSVKTWDDWCAIANPTTNTESQDVNNTYFFQNRKSYTGALAWLSTLNRNYCVGSSYDNPQLNRDVFHQDTTFDGTSGVGCGTLTSRPSSCTPGVGYWATDQSCSDLTGLVGAHPTRAISGTLYKCTSTDTWEAYYTPYTYPHPLRSQHGRFSGSGSFNVR